MFVPCGATAFPVMYARVTRKTRTVFAAMDDLVAEFVHEHVMANFGKGPLLLFGKYLAVSQSSVAGLTVTIPRLF